MGANPLYHNPAAGQPLDPGPRHDPDLPPEGCALADRAEALAVRHARTPDEAEDIRTGFRTRPALTALWVRALVEDELARERPGGDDTAERARRLRLRLAGARPVSGRATRDDNGCRGWGPPDEVRPCETRRLPLFRDGRCARCAELHRLRARPRRDPWPSINDVRLPGDPGPDEDAGRPRAMPPRRPPPPAGSFAARRTARAAGHNRRRDDGTRQEDEQP